MYTHEHESASDLPNMDGPALHKTPTPPQRGALQAKLEDAYNITNQHTENMHRMGRLFDRLQGPQPEEVNGNQAKMSEPTGILEAVDFMNAKSAHAAEIMNHMIAKLEELI